MHSSRLWELFGSGILTCHAEVDVLNGRCRSMDHGTHWQDANVPLGRRHLIRSISEVSNDSPHLRGRRLQLFCFSKARHDHIFPHCNNDTHATKTYKTIQHDNVDHEEQNASKYTPSLHRVASLRA